MESGLINLNKPSGMTSRRAVDIVARLCGSKKVGHAGTLDPLAKGVLVLCLGKATRLIEYVQRMPKCYAGTFLLGRQSPTEDIEGKVVELSNPPIPKLTDLKDAAKRLTGVIEQRPPVFSALKINGRRAYDLARAGEVPVLKPRTIHVYALSVVSYQYPEITLEVKCSSGTYIRSLGRDLAESLGTAAVMSQLTRTAIGNFRLDKAINVEELSQERFSEYLLPPKTAIETLPKIDLTVEDMKEICHGRTVPSKPIAISNIDNNSAHSTEFAGIAPDGRLACILVSRGNNRLHPKRNIFS